MGCFLVSLRYIKQQEAQNLLGGLLHKLCVLKLAKEKGAKTLLPSSPDLDLKQH